MRRRKKWQPPNNPTSAAKQVWRHLFPEEPWPSKWQVEWAGFMRGALGLTLYRRRTILLSYADAKRGTAVRWEGVPGAVATLVHEFVHVRCPKMRHGGEFRRIERSLLARIGLVEPCWRDSSGQ